ncbi:VirK/YbjX family protein [Mitsuokella jalaludinii]|uniref:VirK/YbjX family protein n=1 Tax=Mitsuokella jalaludinii TaxID=187979 RepID=UPI003F97781C
MLDYIRLGKKIYNTDNPREARRMAVFVVRCLLNNGRMQRLHQFFSQSDIYRNIADEYPFVYEQPTRAFFYNKSTFDERARLVEKHMEFLVTHLREDVVLSLYTGHPYVLWESQDEMGHLRFELFYHPGQRKEGLMSIVLRLDEHDLYQMMFWIAPTKAGEWALWIGAMQGPNMENAKDVVKKVTKRCHAYRTKNFILHATQEAAKALGLKQIYAVTNYGYYANNHIRRDRKLKTSFSDFWKESGGRPCADQRFYELPMTEYRKTMEEIPTRKRSNYRKRYALLDEVDAAIAVNIQSLLK